MIFSESMAKADMTLVELPVVSQYGLLQTSRNRKQREKISYAHQIRPTKDGWPLVDTLSEIPGKCVCYFMVLSC